MIHLDILVGKRTPNIWPESLISLLWGIYILRPFRKELETEKQNQHMSIH